MRQSLVDGGGKGGKGEPKRQGGVDGVFEESDEAEGRGRVGSDGVEAEYGDGFSQSCLRLSVRKACEGGDGLLQAEHDEASSEGGGDWFEAALEAERGGW